MDLAALIAADFSWFSLQSWWAILQVVAGVGFVIFVHELGHFLVAKACGVKCEKFYVGFDFFDIKIGDRVIIPRSLIKFQRGETEYGVGIVPLGGYVKMLGQEDNPSNMEKENRRARGEGEPEPAEPEVPASVEQPQSLDPRSFMAKSVPQRMAIISAGVIFNLFFAVLFAGLAFRSGATYVPPAIGSTIVGGPGWRANLGGSVVQTINGKSTGDRYFPFIDLSQETALSGGDGPVTLELVRPGSSEVRAVEVMPEANIVPEVDLPLLGIGPENAATIASDATAIVAGQAGSRASPPLQPGDQIVGVNGQELPHFIRDGRRHVPVTPLRALMAQLADQSVMLDIRRGENNLTVEVPPNPAPSTGLVTGWSAIKAIQQDSPADIAGLRAGDLVIAIGGQPVGDPLDADLQISRWMRANQLGASSTDRLMLTVVRGVNGQPAVPDSPGEEVEVTPRWPVESGLPGNEPLAISTLGIAIQLRPVISAVVPGSAAESAGLQAGDRIRKVRLLTPGKVEPDSDLAGWVKSIREAKDNGKERHFFGEFHRMVRELPVGTRYELTVERAGQVQPPVVVASQLSETSFLPTRGMRLSELTSEYRSRDWAESLALGARQTWTDAGRIWKTLGKLVTGKISPTNLGGPGTIAVVATSEATEGTSRLLLFLTMLSANLAIINFLPIPVLDGGHMLFLAYEGIFRRPVTEKVQIALSYFGLFFILGLMVFVFSLDIFRIANLF